MSAFIFCIICILVFYSQFTFFKWEVHIRFRLRFSIICTRGNIWNGNGFWLIVLILFINWKCRSSFLYYDIFISFEFLFCFPGSGFAVWLFFNVFQHHNCTIAILLVYFLLLLVPRWIFTVETTLWSKLKEYRATLSTYMLPF